LGHGEVDLSTVSACYYLLPYYLLFSNVYSSWLGTLVDRQTSVCVNIDFKFNDNDDPYSTKLIPPPPTTLDAHKPLSHSLTTVCGNAACLAYQSQLAVVTAACKRLQQHWLWTIESIDPGHCTVKQATTTLTSVPLSPANNFHNPAPP